MCEIPEEILVCIAICTRSQLCSANVSWQGSLVHPRLGRLAGESLL